MADPAVWITGTGPDKQLNFRLPTGGRGDKGDKGDKGADGSNVLPTDTAIATAINASGSATKTALSATIATGVEEAATDPDGVLVETFSPPVNAIQEFMGKVRNGVRDLSIMIVGDSTAAANTSTPGIPLGSWAYRLPAKLAALIPTHTIEFKQFNDGTPGSYGATSITIAGTGTQKITIWNAAVAGKTWEYFLDSTRAATMLSAPAADLIFIDNGHNDNLAALQAGTDGPQKSKAYLAIEQIRTLNPDAAVVLMSQNAIAGVYPKASQYRADMYRLMARKRGWGFIDICHAFVTDGRPLSTLLSADNLHPSDAGYELWVNEVMKYFRAKPTSQQIPALPPAFTQYARNYAKNNGFNQFDAPPVLTNWTASNATLSKDTAVFETGTYSVKLKKAATGDSYMEQALPTADMRGKTVTFLVRMRIASGNSGSAGQITIRHDAASAASEVWAQMDQWFWRSVTIKFTSGANNPYVRIIVDPNAGSGALTEINVDRVAVVLGEVPADFDYTAI